MIAGEQFKLDGSHLPLSYLAGEHYEVAQITCILMVVPVVRQIVSYAFKIC